MVLGVSSLYATTAIDGADVYKQKCAMCHLQSGGMNEKGMRAPHMSMVSQRLKSQLKDREEFVAFVKEYIQNPSQAKGYCMPMAFKRFGTMPPIGKSLSDVERQAVAEWLYDNFKGKWGNSKESKACGVRNGSMKCGVGKCGGKMQQQKSMKCGAGKCGAVKTPTH